MSKLKHTVLVLFFLIEVQNSYSQKPSDFQVQDSVKKFYGIDPDKLAPKNWNAHWIWRRGETEISNVMLCARKTFELESMPESSRLYITADSHYSLWVNGEFISRGPARSAPHHQSFDILDISSKLKKGKNVLAIKVQHSGNTVTFIDKVRPGLLFQLELPGNEKAIIISDQNVKVRNEGGWDVNTPQLDGSNMARVENFDFRKSVLNWEKADFDDSNWENAALIRQQWWPPRKDNEEDFARMSPWHTLVPRDIPYLEEKLRPVTKLFEIGECAEFNLAGNDEVEHMPVLGIVQHQVMPLKHCKVDNLNGFLNQKDNLKIQNYAPASLYENEPFRNTWVVFDMGELLLGYPELEIEATKGTNVNVSYGAYLIDGRFNPAILSDNQGDRVVLPGGKIRWHAQELRTFRYLGLFITGTEKPITISYAGVRQTWYPFKEVKSMDLGEDLLNKLSKASEKTLRIITHDAFTDNYRERRQYIQTAWYAAKGNYSTFGDPYLMRRCLLQISEDQLQNGFMPMHAPGKPKAGILEADLMWQMGLYDYYMFTGDAVTTKKLLIPLSRDLDALEDLQNEDGIFDSPPHPYWIDHADLDRRGISFTLNGWYALALEDDAKLFRLFGDLASAKKCTDKANTIKKYLKLKFWDPVKGLFAQNIIEGKQTGTFDEISNGVALILKIADADQQRSIAEKIFKNDETRVMVRPVVMMYWPVEGLFSAGYGREAVEILKGRYRSMMQDEEGTLWEGWNLYTFNQNGRILPKIRTATQAEQVFHPDVFSRHLLGVETMQPGSKELRISYKGSNNQSMNGVIPTICGDVTIDWHIEPQYKVLEITSPRAVKITVNQAGLPKGMIVKRHTY